MAPLKARLKALRCRLLGHRWVEHELDIPPASVTHRTVAWSARCTRCGDLQGPWVRVKRKDRLEQLVGGVRHVRP